MEYQQKVKINLKSKTRTHRGQRSQNSIEYRKAKQFCFKNSKYDPKRQELIFLGTQESTRLAIELELDFKTIQKNIPDTPQGLVLTDNRGKGAFQ